MEQADKDIRRTVDLLGSRPEINPQRIGITGISLGGIIAATVAGAEPRIYRAGLILAGGDLWKMIHFARETGSLSKMIRRLPAEQQADLEAKIRAVDPLTLAPALRERAQQGRVLMINAAEDEVIPRACTERLAAALGIADKVIWLQGLGHYTTLAELPRALRTTTDFFAQDLPAGVSARAPAAAAEPTALARGIKLLQQALTIALTEPAPGRCHVIDVEVAGGWKGRDSTGIGLRFAHGANGRFALKCRLPKLGSLWLGQGAAPWMVAGKTVLLGAEDPVEDKNPLAFADSQRLNKLRMISGLLGSLALVPDTLTQFMAVDEVKTADGHRAVRLAIKQKVVGNNVVGRVVVSFQDDGQTPAQAVFDFPKIQKPGTQVKITIRGWQVNTVADDAWFAPPVDLPTHELDQADLYHVFSAIFDFAMEQTE